MALLTDGQTNEVLRLLRNSPFTLQQLAEHIEREFGQRVSITYLSDLARGRRGRRFVDRAPLVRRGLDERYQCEGCGKTVADRPCPVCQGLNAKAASLEIQPRPAEDEPPEISLDFEDEGHTRRYQELRRKKELGLPFDQGLGSK